MSAIRPTAWDINDITRLSFCITEKASTRIGAPRKHEIRISAEGEALTLDYVQYSGRHIQAVLQKNKSVHIRTGKQGALAVPAN